MSAAKANAAKQAKVMPANWKELFFPEVHNLPGS